MGDVLHIKRVVIGSQTFVSFSAHELLAALSDADDSRPGHPVPGFQPRPTRWFPAMRRDHLRVFETPEPDQTPDDKPTDDGA